MFHFLKLRLAEFAVTINTLQSNHKHFGCKKVLLPFTLRIRRVRRLLCSLKYRSTYSKNGKPWPHLSALCARAYTRAHTHACTHFIRNCAAAIYVPLHMNSVAGKKLCISHLTLHIHFSGLEDGNWVEAWKFYKRLKTIVASWLCLTFHTFAIHDIFNSL